MNETERDQIQQNVLKIVNRVKKYGRRSEAVHIKLDIKLQGQTAINYKVLKLFSPQISDSELVELLFQLGVQNGAEIVKTIAAQNGIKI